MDFECLRPFDSLLTPTLNSEPHGDSALPPLYQTAYFAQMGRDANFIHSIPNAWMASTPFHPFFMLSLHAIPIEHQKTVEEETGPIALRAQIQRYDNEFKHGAELLPYLRTLNTNHAYFDEYDLRHSITMFSTDVIYPLAWNGDNVPEGCREICHVRGSLFDREACKEGLRVWERGAHCITYWTHTW